MLSKQIYSEKTVSLKELFPNFTHEFLEPFKGIVGDKFKHNLQLDFNIVGKKRSHKVSPILRLARPEDAEGIIEIYKELYDGTYPYKEMENIDEVRKKIEDPNIQWIIYQDPSFNIAGCITFVLDFDNKRGYIRGFMLRKKYQGYIDITKAMIASMLGMLHKFKDIIYVWYVENRTAHSKSQYSMAVCGISPIGFYPNKDVFCGEIESDMMQILYDERVLKEFHSKKVPQLISEVGPCYQYSKVQYGLESASVMKPQVSINKSLARAFKKSIYKKIKRDKFGYETITLKAKNSASFFEFLYTPQVQNFEKTKYKVKNLEELYAFVKEFLRCKKELEVRYCEVFISAYKREHQQIFYDAGFKPRGYIPSWKYSTKRAIFKDSVLFSLFEGKISDDIQLIDQGYELIEVLGFNTYSQENSDSKSRETPKKKKLYSFPTSKRIVKPFLLSAMTAYLSLLVISLLIAMNFGNVGFNITQHTISDLGNSFFTPAPFLFDFACSFSGAITIPYSFYICNVLAREGSLRKKIITHAGLISGVIGGLGYMCVGIFSLERPGPNGAIHIISAGIAFTGFVLSILFFSIPLLLRQNIMPKIFGASGIILPLIILILNIILITPLLEWLLLFSILFHIVPLNYLSIAK